MFRQFQQWQGGSALHASCNFIQLQNGSPYIVQMMEL
jgi:hypothetical protein